MNPRKSKDISAALLKKGFREGKGDHHFYFFWIDNKRSSVRTKISHDNKEYGSSLLMLMAKQLHVSADELGALLDCPLTREKYIALLRERGIVS